MAQDDEIKKLKRLLLEAKGESVALRCMMPAILAHLATSLSDEPNEWMRDFHSQVALMIDQHLPPYAGDALRNPALKTLDDVTTAVRFHPIG